MYTYRPMPGNLQGIDSMNFASYWQAIKDRIEDLRQLPVWATNHAMKLGITVSRLQAQGKTTEIAALKHEIDKVNDDIRKAWKVKGYIDSYLPEWMAVAENKSSSGAPIVPSYSQPTIVQSTEFEGPQLPGATSRVAYVEPSLPVQVTSWLKNLVGLQGHQDRGLGFIPLIIISAAGIAALAYTVTVGMSLYQDYKFKKDLTQEMIDGKVSSGQIAQILTASRPDEGIISKIASQAGGNLATIAVLGGIGYLAFIYLTSKRATP